MPLRYRCRKIDASEAARDDQLAVYIDDAMQGLYRFSVTDAVHTAHVAISSRLLHKLSLLSLTPPKQTGHNVPARSIPFFKLIRSFLHVVLVDEGQQR